MLPVFMVLHRGLGETLKGTGYRTASRCSDHRDASQHKVPGWGPVQGVWDSLLGWEGAPCVLPASDAELYEIEFHSSLTS